MNPTVEALVQKIQELETEAERELEQQRQKFFYTIERKRVVFEAAVRARHRQLRTGLVRFLGQSGVARLLAAPIVYGLIVPLVIADLAVSLFQFVCFPIYGIAKVPRSDFIVVDRHNLAYLNPIEKLNCAYCGYANGLLAYAREIAGRAEAHWCPIKHARQTRSQHRRYYGFAEFGDVDGYRRKEETLLQAKERGERE